MSHEYVPNKNGIGQGCIVCGKPRISWEHNGYSFCLLDPVTIIHGGKRHLFTSTNAARKAGFMINIEERR